MNYLAEPVRRWMACALLAVLIFQSLGGVRPALTAADPASVPFPQGVQLPAAPPQGALSGEETLPEYYQPSGNASGPGAGTGAKAAAPSSQVVMEPIDPARYFLNTGDQLQIALARPYEIVQSVTVSPDGVVVVSPVGALRVRHLSLAALQRQVASLFQRYYYQPAVTVTLIQPRTFMLEVVGEVGAPGRYKATPFTHLSDALALAGGITAVGSWRNIEVRNARAGHTDTVDLFKILLLGHTADDINLDSGDVVFIPPRRQVVAVKGEVNREGKYELAKGERAQDLIAVAGGLTPAGVASKAWLERRSDVTQRSITSVDLSHPENNPELQDGDTVVIPHYALYQNTITLMGEFAATKVFEVTKNHLTGQPEINRVGLYRVKQGERVGDVLVNVGGATSKADLRHAAVIRTKQDGTRDLFPLDLTQVAVGLDSEHDMALQPGDLFVIPTIQDTIYVTGQVKSVGPYPYSPGLTVADYIMLAGGPADRAVLSSVRVARGDPANPKVMIVDARILKGQGGTAGPVLEPGDVVYVPRTDIVSWRDFLDIITNIYVFQRLFIKQ